ncbi:MAG: NUDIX hydrolase [Alphaproteobacteria bacterium]
MSAFDPVARLGWRTAHVGAHAWYWMRRPLVRGAQVAVWHDGRLLLLRQSYRRAWVLPGGMMRRREDADEAASRELAEEAGIVAAPEDLHPALVVRYRTPYGPRRQEIFEIEFTDAPTPAIDRREIVDARFVAPADAAALRLDIAVQTYLRAVEEASMPMPEGELPPFPLD